MAEFIFEIIVDVIGEAIFESFDRSKSKKVNIIICVLQYSFLIGLFLFLFFLAKNYAVEVGETRTIFYIVSGLLLLFVILFFVLFIVEMWYVVNQKFTKKVTERIVKQYDRIIEKATKLGMNKYIVLPDYKGVAFSGNIEEPKLIIRVYPRNYGMKNNLHISVSYSDKDECSEYFDEDDYDNIEIATKKAVQFVEKYYGKKVRFLNERVEHQYILEKEEFFNEESGSWEVFKDEKDDSKFSKLFVFKSKSEIKEYDFR